MNQLIIVIVAILCITILECIALYLGIDGAILSSIIAVIAGLAGYQVKKLRNKK